MSDVVADLTRSLDSDNPWPGLMPFTEATQAFFHGRDAEAAELLRRVRRERLTILFGQSGLGKTSLLCAGLFPRLRAVDFLPVYLRLDWTTAHISPVAQIKQALAENLAEHGVEGRPPRPDETLWGYFHDKETEFWSRRNRLVTPVLVFDQFEEIFTLGQGAASAETLDELAALIESRPPDGVRRALDDDSEPATRYDFAKESCKVILALREDFLPDLEGLRRRIPSIMDNRMRLTRMDGRQARDAILASGAHLVAPGMAEKVIAFVAASRGRADEEVVGETELAGLEIEPALLSIVCSELNNKRIRLGQAQITADLLEGAQQEIVGQFYESSLTGIDQALKLFIEEQLLTAEAYRDSRPLAEALREPGVTRADIDKLVARRLLRIEERFGTQWVELTHDLLTGVIRQQRDLRREQTEAEARVQAERERAERAEAEAVRERAEREAQTALAREASEREQAARGLVRRTRIALAATMLTLVLAILAGIYAWDQRRLAEQQATEAANQRQLADQRAVEGAQQRRLAEDHSKEAMRIQQIIIQALAGNAGNTGQFKDLVQGLRAYQHDLEELILAYPSDNGRRGELAIIHLWIVVGLSQLDDHAATLVEAREFQSITAQLAAADPENLDLLRYLAFSHNIVASQLQQESDLSGALTEYRANLEIFKHLTETETSNQMDQRFLGFAHKMVANVLKEQRDLTGVVSESQEYRSFLNQMLVQNPSDPDWQTELATIDRQIADALRNQGDLSGALREFRAELEIRTALVTSNPNNSDRQYQTAVDHNRIGDVLDAQRNFLGAAEERRVALATLEKLTAKNPANENWQTDLAYSHDRLGDALKASGDLAGALQEYRARLMINTAFAEKDPANQARQRDVAHAHNRVGLILAQQGNGAEAAREHHAALTILKLVAASDPGDDSRQRELSTTHDWLGDALQRAGDLDGALQEIRARLAIDTALAKKHPADADRQRDVANAHRRIGSVLHAQTKESEATDEFRTAIEMTRHRVEEGSANADQKRDLAAVLLEFSDVRMEAGDAVGAVSATEEVVQIRRQLYAEDPRANAKAALADALGENSFYLLFNRRAQEAAACAEEALALTPSATWLETNRAHAYLFLGQFEKAKAIYLANKDKLLNDGRTFAAAVTDDFAMFRKNGLEIPAMREIEVLLSA